MSKRYDRTEALIGADNTLLLRRSRVLVVGLGGVGGAAVECLARLGVSLTLVDGDVFEESNLNRQILCTQADVGRRKAELARERALAIDGTLDVTAVTEFVDASNAKRIVGGGYSYCIDAIDDMAGKLALILACKEADVPVVSAMGAGNRTDCGFEVTDLFKTKNDPFARNMRRALKDKISSLDVVCATSPPLIRSGVPASVVAPPLVMGAMLANHVMCRLIKL